MSLIGVATDIRCGNQSATVLVRWRRVVDVDGFAVLFENKADFGMRASRRIDHTGTSLQLISLRRRIIKRGGVSQRDLRQRRCGDDQEKTQVSIAASKRENQLLDGTIHFQRIRVSSGGLRKHETE